VSSEISNQLNSSSDFEWYKKHLDVEHRHAHVHRGEPTHYPCRVHSHFIDNGNNDRRNPPPDEYEHRFEYRTTTKCQHCGHEVTHWPGEFNGTEARIAPIDKEGT